MTIAQILEKRNKNVEFLAIIAYEIKEYYKRPIETYDIIQARGLYESVLREIKQFDKIIHQSFIREEMQLQAKVEEIEKMRG